MKDTCLKFPKFIVGHSEFYFRRQFYRPEFQLEITFKFKTSAISLNSDLTMSFLAQRLTIEHISSQNSKNSIMADFSIILGPEYAKKRLIFSKIFFFQKKFCLMAVSGQTFDNYNASIECSIQSHEFKVMFTTYRSF